MLTISELTANTAWIAQIDSEFCLDVSGRALWAVFSAENAEGIPTDALDSVDVYTENGWVASIDATADEISEARLFRYIVMAN